MNNIEIDGNTIEYQAYGNGYPLVFIHGAFSSGNTWRKIIPELSKHFRCIVPEWPFGGHQTPISTSMDFSPLGIANLCSKILKKLNIDKAMIVANDTGGAYAQVFASKFPHQVSHLVLSNCEGFEIFPPKKFQSLQTFVHVPGYLGLMAKFFSFQAALKLNMTFGLLSHTLKKEELYNFYVKNFCENKGIRNDFRKIASAWSPKYTQDAAKELAEFKQPVLIIWGTDDKVLFPMELGKRLNALFQHSTFVEAPNSLTYVQEDNPSIFIESILKFSEENPPQ